MPTSYVKKLAKEKGMGVSEVEKKWRQAKEIARKEGHDSEYDYITGVFKRMMRESYESSILIPTQLKVAITRFLKSKKLEAMLAYYKKMLDAGDSIGNAVSKTANVYGVNPRHFMDVVDYLKEKGLLSEGVERIVQYLSLVVEDVPTNTQGSTMPGRQPTDGGCEGEDGKCGVARRKKRCKLGDIMMKESKYRVYHSTYSDAVQEALRLAEKAGYTVDEDEYYTTVTIGPRKPSEGKTNSFKLQLYKNDKPTNHMLVFQIYGLKNRYELNAYIS